MRESRGGRGGRLSLQPLHGGHRDAVEGQRSSPMVVGGEALQLYVQANKDVLHIHCTCMHEYV